MDEKKLILFIVEGSTDETSLAPALEAIIENKTVKFKVMHTDITSDYDSTVSNIEERIKEQAVRKFLLANHQFTARDICAIVHIVDLDGAFTSDDIVGEDAIEQALYFDDSIICKNLTEYIRSKNNKMANLLHLIQLSEIKIPYGYIVPYSIYFMSCNLDHVLHNKRNSTQEEKINNSFAFTDEYDDPEKFKAFMNSKDVKVPGTYQETWQYVKNGNNSLKRGSNLWICVDKYENGTS